MEQDEGVIANLFFEDGSHLPTIENYKFEQSGVEISIEQMDQDNRQLTVGVPLVVWGAATSLSEWIDINFQSAIPQNTKKAIELGSGTGLLGIYTVKALLKNLPENDPSIILTDMEDSSIELINKNIKHNGLSESEAVSVNFFWGDFSHPALNEPHQFDLVVGSDIIYSDIILKPLAQTISHLLTERGVALIANNSIRYDNQNEEFLRQLELNGLKVIQRHDLKKDFATMRLLIIQRA